MKLLLIFMLRVRLSEFKNCVLSIYFPYKRTLAHFKCLKYFVIIKTNSQLPASGHD